MIDITGYTLHGLSSNQITNNSAVFKIAYLCVLLATLTLNEERTPKLRVRGLLFHDPSSRMVLI